MSRSFHALEVRLKIVVAGRASLDADDKNVCMHGRVSLVSKPAASDDAFGRDVDATRWHSILTGRIVDSILGTHRDAVAHKHRWTHACGRGATCHRRLIAFAVNLQAI